VLSFFVFVVRSAEAGDILYVGKIRSTGVVAIYGSVVGLANVDLSLEPRLAEH